MIAIFKDNVKYFILNFEKSYKTNVKILNIDL